MSMRSLLSAVRASLINDDDITEHVSADKITFARRPQRDTMPGITFSIGTVSYDESITRADEATTYRININVYGRTADETTLIHDLVKANMKTVSSDTYLVRLEDERYGVDVDNNHVALLATTWQISTGRDDVTTVNYLSPAFQGFDRMDVNYNYKAGDDATTTLGISEQVYYFDFTSSSGQVQHNVQLPNSRDNAGKIYTILCGTNVDNNSVIRLLPDTGETVETAQHYDLNRAHCAINLVAVKTGAGENYGWRIWAYHGLHD